jgi:PPOX class probable F420-dependent enzyme
VTPEEMRRRLAESPVGRLATIDPDGRPNVVPFVFALDGETLFTTVDAKPKGTARLQRLRNLERDPRCTVLVDHYDDDWKRLWWVRVRGRGRMVEDDDERARAAAALEAKYPQYGEVDVGEVVIAIDADEWSAWAWG